MVFENVKKIRELVSKTKTIIEKKLGPATVFADPSPPMKQLRTLVDII
jgi:hypothetical protein